MRKSGDMRWVYNHTPTWLVLPTSNVLYYYHPIHDFATIRTFANSYVAPLKVIWTRLTNFCEKKDFLHFTRRCQKPSSLNLCSVAFLSKYFWTDAKKKKSVADFTNRWHGLWFNAYESWVITLIKGELTLGNVLFWWKTEVFSIMIMPEMTWM